MIGTDGAGWWLYAYKCVEHERESLITASIIYMKFVRRTPIHNNIEFSKSVHCVSVLIRRLDANLQVKINCTMISIIIFTLYQLLLG
jgi:hypothetical protein